MMKIFVEAKPDARNNHVAKIDEYHFKVQVADPPVQGRANRAIIALLSEYFNVSKSQIKLLSGFSSKKKVFDVIK